MKNWISEEELDKRAATPCYHKYVRMIIGNYETNDGRQIESYCCKECGKKRDIVRPKEEAK